MSVIEMKSENKEQSEMINNEIVKKSIDVKPTFTIEGRKNGFIQYGDTVVAYASPQKIQFFKVEENGILNNAFGRYPHKNMIGLEWGTRIVSSTGKGFIYLLYPTPELWTRGLPHRTQILYMPDISLISSFLDLKPGCKVVESGTGSGSFSHCIARTIAPNGHLHSFEFNKERYNFAKKEFIQHGVSPNLITSYHSDVCTVENEPGDKENDIPGKGFWGLENMINSVFLDLPSPWLAIPNARKLFKKGITGRICCFSPCIEQVIKTCKALEENGFSQIKMYEVLLQPIDVRQHIKPRNIPFERKSSQNKDEDNNTDKNETQDDNENQNKKRKIEPEVNEIKDEQEEIKTPMINVSKPSNFMAGHTSYLTFAIYTPTIEELSLNN